MPNQVDDYSYYDRNNLPSKKEDKIQQGEQPRKREYVLFCALVTLSTIILLAIILSTLFLQLFQPNTSTSTSGTQAAMTTTAIPTTTTVTTTGSTTTKTTTSTTTTPYVPTYNEACNTTCRSGTGLTCNGASVCQCPTPKYWSYGSSSCQTCQSGWTGYMDFCWQIFNTQLNHTSSEAYCNLLNLNASLPNLDSDQKFIYMRSKYDQSSFSYFWLWPTTTVPMVFKWKNGQTVKEGYYESPGPNNWGGTDALVVEDCLYSERYHKFKLDDSSCFNFAYFSCEYFT